MQHSRAYVAIAHAFLSADENARETIIAVARGLREVCQLAYTARPFGSGEVAPYYITSVGGVPQTLAHELADKLRALELREEFDRIQLPLEIPQLGITVRFAGETEAHL